MNFYDILAAEKWGGGIPTTNFFDLLFAQFISGKKWEIYEGTLPATLNANGSDLRQYQIWGNVGGVGDRTENLFDLSTVVVGKYIDSNGNEQSSTADPSLGTRLHHSDYFPVEAEQEYVFFSTCGARLYTATVAFCWYDADKNFLSRTTTTLPVDESATEYSFNGAAPQNARFAIVNFVTNRYANVIITQGTTPPQNYVPFGYKIDMNIRSGNLFDYNGYVYGYYISSSGVETEGAKVPEYESVWLSHSNYINVLPNESYTISAHHQSMNIQQTVAIAWYNENKIFILRDSTIIPPKNAGSYSFTATAPQNAKFAIFNFFADNVQKVMFTSGTTPPDEYQPYYNTVTPIYIGSDPLEKDEYVDYQAQKVYRVINGTLTPTDPPVTLPALSTVDGTTIVDYAGSSGTAPEKVYFEYQGGRQP